MFTCKLVWQSLQVWDTKNVSKIPLPLGLNWISGCLAWYAAQFEDLGKGGGRKSKRWVGWSDFFFGVFRQSMTLLWHTCFQTHFEQVHYQQPRQCKHDWCFIQSARCHLINNEKHEEEKEIEKKKKKNTNRPWTWERMSPECSSCRHFFVWCASAGGRGGGGGGAPAHYAVLIRTRPSHVTAP